MVLAQIIHALLTVALLVVMGLMPAMACRQKRTITECVGLALSLGMLMTGLLLFWASLGGLLPGRLFQGTLTLVACLVVLLTRRYRDAKTSGTIEPSTAVRWVEALPALLVCAVGALVMLNCWLFPVTEGDAFAIWAFKGRVLALETLRSHPALFHDAQYSFSHHDYPLLIPMLMAGFYSAAGAFTDQIAKTVLVLVFVALVLIAYSGMSRLGSRLVAIIGVAILVSTPSMTKWAASGYVDVAVALYCCGAAVYLALYIRDAQRVDMLLGLLHLTGLAFTKNEGMVIALGYSVVLVAFCMPRFHRRQLRAVLSGLGGVALLLAPFLVWRTTVPQTHENYGARLLGEQGSWAAARVPYVLVSMLREMLNPARWGLLWYLPIASLALGVRQLRHREVSFLVSALFVQLMAYVLAYVVSPFSPERLIPGTIDRLVLQASPLAVLLAAAVVGTLDHASASADAAAQQSVPITK